MAHLLLAILAMLLWPIDGSGVLYWPVPVCVKAPTSHVIATGFATYYAPGIMDRVYLNRLAMGHVRPCPECEGRFVALMNCKEIGRRVWLRHDGVVSGPYLVIDCAASCDLASVTARRIVVEVSWEQGLAWGMRGPVAVEVLDGP